MICLGGNVKHKASKGELHLGSLEVGKSSQSWKTKEKSNSIMPTMAYLRGHGYEQKNH